MRSTSGGPYSRAITARISAADAGSWAAIVLRARWAELPWRRGACDDRAVDLALSDDQELIRDTFRSFFEQESNPEVVRAAEPGGFAPELWKRLVPTGAIGMGVPEASGGGGAGLLEMALVAEELGRRLAPVPFVEASVAARLLAGAGAKTALERVLDGSWIATLALHPLPDSPAQLVPAGAIADVVLGMDGDALVAIPRPQPGPAPVPNHACAPLARWPLASGSREVLVRGPAARALYAQAQEEWKLVTGAALVGLAREALRIAADYAKGRVQFGQPIGSYQGIAHPLADRATEVDGAGLLVHEAIWAREAEPARAPALASLAFAFAAETASRTAAFGLHTHGGYGFTLEYDIQLYLRRAKGWALIWSDPRAELQRAADHLWGAVR
jgi:alkylation response protein AidB-like acyl-CoA dehydrogenase